MTILITGGRAPASLDLARVLHRAGHVVLIAESQSAQITRRSRAVTRVFTVPGPRAAPAEYRARVLELVHHHRVDLIIPTCEEIFYLAPIRADLPAHCALCCDSFTTLDQLHDKWRFVTVAAANGMSAPETRLITSADELRDAAGLGGEWVLKPVYSRFGHRAMIGPVSKLIALRPQFDDGQTYVLQRFVAGTEYCAYALAHQGRLRALSVYHHEFVAGRAGVCFEEVWVPAIDAQIEALVGGLKFHGQIAFDFIVDHAGRAFVLECNPRATSGVHLLAGQADLPGAFVNAEADAPVVRAPTGTRAMLGLPMLVFGLGQARSFAKLRAWISMLISSREVMFDRRDPVPFVDQLLCFARLTFESWRSGRDLLSASTADIEWNGRSEART